MAKVTIYTTTTCPFCKMEKDYLNSRNLQFDEILVDQNSEEAQKMIALSGQMGVPFTVIEKEDGQKVFILGFDRPKIEAALRISS
ncbi:hypothetical protein A3D81_01640 [Candidatus Curtissbacteria bacterium RIFCSPHIGHO2_02_FULL_40_17]|uniref:Glutaredoxin domain-containing protein n=4 Tax=Candidatus Curtissiibacteriota TaxID=1752717 RepID=A0A1F5GH26_9BACT|nr:MAG: hypothetical protein A2693_03400 [Candidatus Curtissbacteria bacterium RIFCSPHIGHO2_01_FULL_40_12]OGD91160.1 MAG: hypothetical protein A3D81_01640 [Candidatus Curtissbacteria bacterium RIFCSPHIGHO2_02_FULL_40_17]OGE05464.1 MAG: hypothetical protein A3F45_03735 [Candidatus Curtissbacteria bacterium RIFCSPHIGHO2_12_FULL_41_17]OGE07134.1 MAG: hypothetical protein A3I53_02965 [Candidatus Curtissbacteria bacterium RIFCSPLOWO2_02_FULL_40_13b]